MKTIFSAGAIQNLLVERINAPLVTLLSMASPLIPEPTKENTQHPNSHIAIELRDRFFKHAKARVEALRAIINYGIIKYDYDEYYRGCIDWLLAQWLQTKWYLPNHALPPPQCWDAIPAGTRERLENLIMENYQLLQERLSTIQQKLGDSEEGKIHKASRIQQFMARILNDVEREVMSWK